MDAWTSSCGFRTGSDRSMSVLITEKIAVFAPMPSASVSTATAVKPGFFSNWRKANLRSFITQCLHRIDFGRAARWHEAGQERHRQQHERHHPKRQRISGANAEQQIS